MTIIAKELVIDQTYHVLIRAYDAHGDFTARFAGWAKNGNGDPIAMWQNGVTLQAWGWIDSKDDSHGWYCETAE